jgi:hypothetical protein
MDIGTVLLGLDAIRAEPGLREITAGVLVHQTADLWWTVVLFVLGRRWTLMLTAKTLLIIALPWALVTSAIEYFVILPTLQPFVPMQVPYWTALLVHVTSAAAYPFFPWIRSHVAGVTDPVATQWASRAAIVLALVALPPAVVETLGGSAREPGWPFTNASSSAFDRTFMQQMEAHHDVGVQLARVALETEPAPEAATLARLVIAEQTREAVRLRDWWQSWSRRGHAPSDGWPRRRYSGHAQRRRSPAVARGTWQKRGTPVSGVDAQPSSWRCHDGRRSVEPCRRSTATNVRLFRSPRTIRTDAMDEWSTRRHLGGAASSTNARG